MHLHHTILVILLFAARYAHALKGETSLRSGSTQIRSLQVMKGEATEGMMASKGPGMDPTAKREMAQNDPAPKDKGAMPGAPAGDELTVQADGLPGPKGDKAKKEDKDKKKDKKDKKEKKCKKPKGHKRRRTQVVKAPKTDKAGVEKGPKVPKTAATSPAMEPVMQPDTMPVESSGVEPDLAEERFCLQSILSEEQCAAIRGGELPIDDKTTSGILSIELSHSSESKEAHDLLSQVLRSETPSKFIGCSSTFRKMQVEDGEDGISEVEEQAEEYPYVSGLSFADFIVSLDACESAPGDGSCDKIETDIDIFYDGKDATQDEKNEMFALLTEVIRAQNAAGSFAEAGNIQSIKATSTGSDSDDPSVGLPVGVVVAALVVLAAAGGYYYYSRKRSLVVNGGPKSSDKQDQHQTDDSSNEGDGRRDEPIEAEAILIDDGAGFKGKKYNRYTN